MNLSSKLPESVIIFGCGYVGTALAKQLLKHGVRVGALTRNPEKAAMLEAMGVQHVSISDLDSYEWHGAVGDYAAAVNCVSSAGGGVAGYRKSYFDGQKSILTWAKSQSLSHYIYTSSTSVYPQSGGAWVDESVDTSEASETGQVLLEAEQLIAESSESLGHWFIFRLAGIYGPQRHFLLNQLREGRGEIAGRGDYTLNLIHLEDIVGVILRGLQQSNPALSGIYNVADNCPRNKEEILGWLAAQLGMKAPNFNPELVSARLRRRGGRMPDRKIQNSKLKAVLDWEFIYPSYREGYANIL